MKTLTTRWCWRRDLAQFRGLTESERSGFLLVLEWFENFRLRHQWEAGEAAAREFWRQDVLREDRPREAWKLEQWAGRQRFWQSRLRMFGSRIGPLFLYFCFPY